MSAPVVIQGTPVGSPHAVSAYASNHHHHHQNQNQNQNQTPSGNSEHEEKKTSGCRDPIFVFLFYGNLAAMIAVAAIYGPSAFDDAATYNYEGYVMAVIIVALISLIFSGLGLLILMRFPETIIKASLIFVVVLSLVWCVVSFLAGSIGSAILGLVFFALGVCYARMAWPRIPFATINLVTGITAIQANFGVTTFAYMFAIIAAGWSVLWSIAFAGLFEYTYDCNDANECTNPNYGYMFLLFVSFFFTHQVLQVSGYCGWSRSLVWVLVLDGSARWQLGLTRMISAPLSFSFFRTRSMSQSLALWELGGIRPRIMGTARQPSFIVSFAPSPLRLDPFALDPCSWPFCRRFVRLPIWHRPKEMAALEFALPNVFWGVYNLY
jgi:hypothetical protein